MTDPTPTAAEIEFMCPAQYASILTLAIPAHIRQGTREYRAEVERIDAEVAAKFTPTGDTP